MTLMVTLDQVKHSLDSCNIKPNERDTWISVIQLGRLSQISKHTRCKPLSTWWYNFLKKQKDMIGDGVIGIA
jgi:hypothetical protein